MVVRKDKIITKYENLKLILKQRNIIFDPQKLVLAHVTLVKIKFLVTLRLCSIFRSEINFPLYSKAYHRCVTLMTNSGKIPG